MDSVTEMTQLYEDAEARRRELSALQNTVRMVAGSLNLPEVLSYVCRAIVETLGFNTSLICLVNREQGTIEAAEGFNVPKELIGETVRRLDGPDILADVVRNTKLEVIAGWDDRFDRGTFERFHSDYGCRIFAPIMLRGEVLGVVEAGCTAERTGVADHEIQLLQSFLDHAAVAIGNARQFQETQRQMQQLQALTSVGSLVSSGKGFYETLDEIVQTARSLMGSRNCILRLLEGEELILGAQVGMDLNGELEERIPSDLGVARVLLETRKYLAIPDLRNLDYIKDNPAALAPGSKMRSYLGAPLISNDKILGIIGLFGEEVHHFSEGEVSVFLAIANQAAVAIQNARQLEEAHRQIEEQRALNAVGSVVATSLDVDEIMSSVVDAASALMNAEICVLRLVEGEWLVIGSYRGFPENSKLTERITTKWGIAKTVLDMRDILAIPDLHSDPRLDDTQMTFYRTSRMRSYLGAPLIASGETVGVLGLFGTSVHHYTERDLSIFRVLANQAAVAIKNALHFQEVRRQMEQLRALTSVGSAISSSLEVDQIMKTVVDTTSSLMSSSACVLRLLEGENLLVGAHRGVPPTVALPDRIPVNECLAGRVVRDETPLIISDLREEGRLDEYTKTLVHNGLRSHLGVPLIVSGELIGVMGVYGSDIHDYSASEVEVISAIANQGAVAIKNARHFQEIRHQMDQLQAMTSVGSVASSSLDVREIMDTVVNAICALTKPETCVLRLVDGDDLLLGAYWSDKGRYTPSERISADLGLAEILVGSRDVVVISDLTSDPRVKENSSFVEANLHSFLGMPLVANGELLGILGVFSQEVREFTEREISIFNAIASQGAVAIENARHFQEIRRQMDQLRALTSVGSVISSSLELKQIMNIVVEATSRLMDAEVCSVRFMDGNELAIGAHKGLNSGSVTERIPSNLGLAGVLTQTREILAIPDLRNDKRLDDYRLVFSDSHLRSFLGAPLIANDELVGILGVYGRTVHNFTEGEVDVFNSIANQAAVAIANARLYEQIARARDELEAKVQERTRDLAETTERIEAILSAISDGIVLVDRDRRITWVNEIDAARHGSGEGLVGKTCYDSYRGQGAPCPECPAARTFETGFVHRAILPTELPDGEIRYHDVVASPIRNEEGNVVQVLELSRDITESRRMEEKLAEYTKKLEQMVAERTVELQRKNEELESFVFTVSHDLKAPIVSIQGFAANLVREYGESLTGDGEFYMQRIRKNTEQLQSLIQELLELSRIGRLPEPWENVSVKQMVEDVAAELQFQIETHGIQLDIHPELPEVICQRKRFRQVFVNLIDNAIHYRRKEVPCHIRVGVRDLSDSWEFSVADNGVGIAPENQRKIFQIFQRLHKVPDAKDGAGVGLAIVKKIVETHGGQIRVESDGEGCGSSFIFTLPKRREADMEQAA